MAAAASIGGGPAPVAAEAPPPTHPGRIVVEERVLVKVAREASADAVGVDRGQVSVDVAQYRGGIAVRIATPLPIPALDDTIAVRAGKPVLDRVASIQQELRDRLARLIGRDVVRVDITVTGAVVAQRKRVR
ncbi:hypothetical protein [Agromyces sp. ZXT2-6]|uniref:hypothetical protein n=1 Tax=Agromyces sp. ZXT2-6 TaxID=3461153 RepID=UPI0040552D6A